MIKQIELDKIVVFLDIKHTADWSKPRKYNKHLEYKTFDNKVKLIFSSKILAKRDDLTGITADNISQIPEIVYKCTPYNVTKEELLSSPVTWLDVKRDILNNTGIKHSDFISILADRASYRTNKDEVITFDKKSGVNDSLVIRSTCKTVYDSFCIYPKIAELRACKRKDPEYFGLFSDDFLFVNANLVRFERRLQNSKTIKKVFGLQHLKAVTLFDIFNSDKDVVAERVEHYFLWENHYEKKD